MDNTASTRHRPRRSQEAGAPWNETRVSELERPSSAVADTTDDHRRGRECGEEEGTRSGGIRRRRPSSSGQGQIESPLGRMFDGPADRLDYAELCESTDSRIDELRLCGNGVVPATAEKAFRTLMGELLAND